MKFCVLFLAAVSGLYAGADNPAPPPDAIVENYCAASRAQEKSLDGASMDVEMDGAFPQLKKHGRLHALRRISPLGLIKYEMLRFEGDKTVITQVINRYLKAEADAQKDPSTVLAVTPENYKFKYKRLDHHDGREVHVYQVTPRQKREGLYKGELWIDAQTYLKVQESGYLVKSPSIAVKKVAFVRTYEIRDGLSVPKQILSIVDTRLIGKAELTIDFTNFSIDSPRRLTAENANQ